MVGKIEKLTAKLHDEAFAQSRVLQNSEIEVAEAWSGDDISPRIAERQQGIRDEISCVEPFLYCMWPPVRIADDIGPVITVAVRAVVGPGEYGKRLACLQRQDASKVPPIRHRSRKGGQHISQRWCCVGKTPTDSVPDIEIRKAALARMSVETVLREYRRVIRTGSEEGGCLVNRPCKCISEESRKSMP